MRDEPRGFGTLILMISDWDDKETWLHSRVTCLCFTDSLTMKGPVDSIGEFIRAVRLRGH
jgi:hypothetical protein